MSHKAVNLTDEEQAVVLDLRSGMRDAESRRDRLVSLAQSCQREVDASEKGLKYVITLIARQAGIDDPVLDLESMTVRASNGKEDS